MKALIVLFSLLISVAAISNYNSGNNAGHSQPQSHGQNSQYRRRPSRPAAQKNEIQEAKSKVSEEHLEENRNEIVQRNSVADISDSSGGVEDYMHTHPTSTEAPPPPPGIDVQKHVHHSREVEEIFRRPAPPPPPSHHRPAGDVPVSAPGLNEPASVPIMVDEEILTRVPHARQQLEKEKDKNAKNEGLDMEHIQESKTREELRYRPVIVGICGGTGSGKTTLTKAIVKRLGEGHVSLISHDSYYRDLQHLPVEERAEVNFDHPAALDSSLLSTHIDMLKEGIPVQCPVYDFTTHSRKKDEYVRIDPSKIVLVDGILIFAEPKILEAMDMKIFVDTADDIRFMRRLQRDVAERARTVESIISQYQKTVRPMHKLFVEPSRRSADIIVPSCDGIQEVALDMVVSRLRELIAQHEADLEELRRRVR